MDFQQAVRSVLTQYATFSGRARRSEFWWWILAYFVIMVVIGVIDAFVVGPALGFAIDDPNAGRPLSVLVALGLLIPNLAVTVRRLHDLDKSGWWILIGFVPILGTLILIFWAVHQGTQAGNRFGDWSA